jgi:hypothetical protein
MRFPLPIVLFCLGASAGGVPVVEIHEDVRITEPTEWPAGHYKIHGNLVLEKGGVLVVTDSTVELMCTYSKEFTYQWRGGRLVTENTTIGGTLTDGTINQCVFELSEGEWSNTDTTVRYTYGISVGGGRFRGTRLKPGPNPDAIHLTSTADVRLEDSEYDITLNLYPGREAAQVTLDLPVRTPITGVFDAGTLVPGVKYRLEMVNSAVPNWWFVFFNGLTMDGPALEVTLNDCPVVIPAVAGYNLKARVLFPSPWRASGPDAQFPPIRLGNLTVRTTQERTLLWSVYASGEETDLTILGPTQIPELILWGGKVLFRGEEGTFNARTTATVIDVGRPGHNTPAELIMRNAAITACESVQGFEYGDLIRAQITAQGAGRIMIERSELAPVTLVTKESGSITLRDVTRKGEVRLVKHGGSITFVDGE